MPQECTQRPRKKNFDKHELDKHAKHANDWYNPQNKVTKLLHEMNKLRVPMVVDGLISTGQLDAAKKNARFPLKGVIILDVGCGAGIFSEGLARLHADMVGLDAAQELVMAAMEHKKLNRTTDRHITYVCDTIEDYADKNPGAFDVIVSSEVVEHVSDKKSFLKACAKALKPGGSLFITTINRTIGSLILAKFLGEYVFRLIPMGHHSWFKFIGPEEIVSILKSSGCTQHDVKGLTYWFLTGWSFSYWTFSSFALHLTKSERSLSL